MSLPEIQHVFQILNGCFSVLREQWIRSKYERKEFVEGAPQPSYLTGNLFLKCMGCSYFEYLLMFVFI